MRPCSTQSCRELDQQEQVQVPTAETDAPDDVRFLFGVGFGDEGVLAQLHVAEIKVGDKLFVDKMGQEAFDKVWVREQLGIVGVAQAFH